VSFSFYSFLSIDVYDAWTIGGLSTAVLLPIVTNQVVGIRESRTLIGYMLYGFGATGLTVGLMTFLYPLASLFGDRVYHGIFAGITALLTLVLFRGAQRQAVSLDIR
jgi:hypothetical protein